MTTTERTLELFTDANPVPDDRVVPPPTSASNYLAQLRQRERTAPFGDDEVGSGRPVGFGEPGGHQPSPSFRTLLLVAAAVAALVVAGLIAIGTRDRGDGAPASPTPTTMATSGEEVPVAPAPTVGQQAPAIPEPGTTESNGALVEAPALLPDPDAERIPSSARMMPAGTYYSKSLGVPIELTTPRDVYVSSQRPGAIELIDGFDFATGEYAPDVGISLTLRRWGGWSTREEATSRTPAASIDPYDIDAWIEGNDVIVLSDTTQQVARRDARVVDVQVDPASTVQAAETAWGCFAGWEPCFHYGDTAPGSRVRTDWVSAVRVTRFYLVTIDGYEPILIEVGAPPGSDWFDEVESTLVDWLVIGANAPPL